jgi:hypothetical protein
MHKHKTALALCACALIFTSTAPSFAQNTAAEMSAQEPGLAKWMHNVQEVGLSCSVSGHASEYITKDHLSDLATPKLKKTGLNVIDPKQATRENKPCVLINISTMPCSGSVEWKVEIRVRDRALRTDKRAAASVIVWEYVVENVMPSKLHSSSAIESTLLTGLGYFDSAVLEGRKESNQPFK